MDQVATVPPPRPVGRPLAKSAPSAANNGPVIAAYAVTIFTSAFLLFQVQPLISKFILPWFGGSPAVWTAAMLFFQVVLFAGYLYAHLTSTFLKPRGQFLLHLGLLGFAAALAVITRISPTDAMKPTGDEHSPLFQILLVLGASVGVPYFALSSTGPLLQKWFSDAFAGISPYRLFALSNVGSLLALLSYPFFFEVYWDSRTQAVMWSIGFVLFAACCSFCAWYTYQARLKHAASAPAKGRHHETASSGDSPSWLLRGAWVGLPALASVMFLAVTNEVCQNVATVPLLWIIPLSFYLLSFIIAFDHPRWYIRPLCAAGAIVLLVYVSNFGDHAAWLGSLVNGLLGRTDATEIDFGSWVNEIVFYFSALLLVCLICHCELAALKPGPKHLTSFFLSMSLGGALGGIFVNLIAPEVFVTFFEMALAFLASAAIAGWLLTQSMRRFGLPAMAAAALASVAALAVIGYWQVLADMHVDPNASSLTLYRNRSFFGLVSVQLRSRHEPQWTNYTFRSGHVPHGKQYADPAKRNDTVLAYWGPDTGCRVTLDYKIKQKPNCRIGVVGLGVGTIAAFAKQGDYLRFYEINPQVTEIAKTYFHFLADCQGTYDIVHGDARLRLEQELTEKPAGHQFDVLCLDAFSGDAIPTHLLTNEAFAIYKQHLAPDGMMVCNITNTYLDIWPVMKRLADEHGYKIARIYQPRDRDSLVERTYFVMITNDEGFLGPVMDGVRERLRDKLQNPDAKGPIPEALVAMPANFQKQRDIPLWTDRYHNLFQILR